MGWRTRQEMVGMLAKGLENDRPAVYTNAAHMEVLYPYPPSQSRRLAGLGDAIAGRRVCRGVGVTRVAAHLSDPPDAFF